MRRRAFTLIEMIASLVVLAVLGSVASSLLMTATDGYVGSSVHGQMHVELSVGMDRAVRELRRIPADATAPVRSPHIDSVSTTSITWRDDASNACALTLTGEELRLTVDGEQPAALLRDVASFEIEAIRDDATQISLPVADAACDVIRQVVLCVTLTRDGESETLRARVFLRACMRMSDS